MENQSLPLLQQAVANSPDRPTVLYEVASAYETLHQREQALEFIDKAIAAGMAPRFLERIPQLSALRADPRYQAIIKKAR